jgi:AraC-like DNA-binding protein
MNYQRLPPDASIAPWVECFWTVEGHDPPQSHKIIPDGYPEIILHFGAPYRTNISGTWKKQTPSLVAGQARKHFMLENTGISSIFGIKMMPSAITHWTGLPMHDITDRVISLKSFSNKLVPLEKLIRAETDVHVRIEAVTHFFRQLPLHNKNAVDVAVEAILKSQGMITVEELCDRAATGERHLERMFKKYVGLSPKFYARIIRFSYIFQIIHDQNPDWADIVYAAGYYDQSHFIRNFKAFTGEDPSAYLFTHPTLANFFLQKKKKITSS